MKRFPLFICLVLLLVTAGIPLVAATPSITGVSPSSGTYGQTVTITVTGSGFDSSSTVVLYHCGHKFGGDTGIVYGDTKTRSATTITATFDLSGARVLGGQYDVVVLPSTYYLAGFTVNGGPSSGTTTTPTPTWTTTTPTQTWTPTPSATTTTQTTTTATTTAPTGSNSAFFETNPPGATISVDGNVVGTSPYVYYTDKDGTFKVVVRKSGYEDYEDRVIIRDGIRAHFYCILTPLSSTSTAATTAPATAVTTSASGKPTTSVSGTPVSNSSTIRKSLLKIPTPLGTDPPVTEESPVDPALALGAAGIAIGLVLLRRR